jgi:hypothetical protein
MREFIRLLGDLIDAAIVRVWLVVRYLLVVAGVSSTITLLALFVSGVTGERWFLLYVAFLHLLLAMIVLFWSHHPLRMLELFVANDLLQDLGENGVTVVEQRPGGGEKETQEVDWPRLSNLQSIKTFLRMLFDLLIIQAVILLFFTVIPVSGNWQLLGPFVLLTLILWYFNTGVGIDSSLVKLKPIFQAVMAIIISIMVVKWLTPHFWTATAYVQGPEFQTWFVEVPLVYWVALGIGLLMFAAQIKPKEAKK